MPDQELNPETLGHLGILDQVTDLREGSNVHTWSIWHQTVSDHSDAQA